MKNGRNMVECKQQQKKTNPLEMKLINRFQSETILVVAEIFNKLEFSVILLAQGFTQIIQIDTLPMENNKQKWNSSRDFLFFF